MVSGCEFVRAYGLPGILALDFKSSDWIKDCCMTYIPAVVAVCVVGSKLHKFFFGLMRR